jgi:hypothetical protein
VKVETPGAEVVPDVSYNYLPFFGGFLIVSITVVVGRRSASFTGMNSPVFASRPIFRVAIATPLLCRRAEIDPLCILLQLLRRLRQSQCSSKMQSAQPPVEVRPDKGPLSREARATTSDGMFISRLSRRPKSSRLAKILRAITRAIVDIAVGALIIVE